MQQKKYVTMTGAETDGAVVSGGATIILNPHCAIVFSVLREAVVVVVAAAACAPQRPLLLLLQAGSGRPGCLKHESRYLYLRVGE